MKAIAIKPIMLLAALSILIPILTQSAELKAIKPSIDNKIETTASRVDILKTDLTGTSLNAAIGIGYATEDQIALTEELRGKKYTINEYIQIKDEIVQKAKNDNFQEEELYMFFDLLNQNCAGKPLTFDGTITSAALADKLDTFCN